MPHHRNSSETSWDQARIWCHDAGFAFALLRAIALASVCFIEAGATEWIRVVALHHRGPNLCSRCSQERG